MIPVLGKEFKGGYKMAKKNVNPNTEDAKIVDTVEETTEQTGTDNKEPKKAPEKKTIKGVVTECIKLNIRKEPSLTAAIVEEISALAEVKIDREASTDDWYSVQTESGKSGFCMKKYISTKK